MSSIDIALFKQKGWKVSGGWKSATTRTSYRHAGLRHPTARKHVVRLLRRLIAGLALSFSQRAAARYALDATALHS
jgi:hypothetical protein